MGKPLEVREFDKICCNKAYESQGYKVIEDKKTFAKLIEFIENNTATDERADVLDFMRVGYQRGPGQIVNLRNYVGLIQMKNGFQIEVLPKITLSNQEDKSKDNMTAEEKREREKAEYAETKKIFLQMLCSLKNFPSKIFNAANLNLKKMSLYEVFINMYLQQVRDLLKYGLGSSYVRQEENLSVYKGKLIVNQHMKVNAAHKERFYIAYDEFHCNRPENKLIKSTLLKLKKITTSVENAREIGKLLLSFELVDLSTNVDKDFAQCHFDRSTKNYGDLIEWSMVFLKNKSFTTFSGNADTLALLFPMESVYESYVAKKVKKLFSDAGWDVSCQDKGKYLFDNPEKRFALRPDIVLKKDERTIVMDTKWKRLVNNSSCNYGISQADMYQMYAYAKKYAQKSNDEPAEVWLLYPVTEEMHSEREIYYCSADGVKVHVAFLDLAEKKIEGCLERLREKVKC